MRVYFILIVRSTFYSLHSDSSHRRITAVNHELRASDERSFVAGKEYHAPSDFFRLCSALQWGQFDQRLQLVARHNIDHRRENYSRMHRVHANLVGSVLNGGG